MRGFRISLGLQVVKDLITLLLIEKAK